jgi:H+/Cl- antiporter ClcA
MSSPVKNSETLLPLITTCVASLIIVKKFYGNSIYETKLLKNCGSRYNEKILKARLLHHRVK